MVDIVLVAAIAQNGVIGANGDLPFKLSTDMKHFKAVTTGKPVVMGRKTFESIGRPLPKRPNFVLTTQKDWQVDGVHVCHTLDDILHDAEQQAQEDNQSEICIIGGGELYKQTIGQANKLIITHVQSHVEGDVTFPDIDPKLWQKTDEHFVKASDKDDADMFFATYASNAVTKK